MKAHKASPSAALYDFPHRRFREVLAADYFAQEENTELLLSQLHRPAVYELLPVFVLRADRFNLVVDRLLTNIFAGVDTIQMGIHLDRLLQESAYSAKISAVLFKLINGLRVDCKEKALPERLLRHFEKDSSRIGEYRSILKAPQTNGTSNLAPLLNKPIAAMQTSAPTARLREMLRDTQQHGGDGWAELAGQKLAFDPMQARNLISEMCPSNNLRDLTVDQAALIIEALDVFPDSAVRVELLHWLKECAPPAKQEGVRLDPIPFLRGMLHVSPVASRNNMRRNHAFQWV